MSVAVEHHRRHIHAHLPWRKRARYRLEYDVATVLLRIGARVPVEWLRRVGSGLGWAACRVIRIRRRVVLENIRNSFPKASAREVDRVALETYRNAGRCLFEIMTFAGLDPDDVRAMVTFEGREHLDEAVAHGRGAILFSGHFGNWELAGAAIGCNGYPIHATDTNHSNKLMHDVITRLRTRVRMVVLSPNEPVASLRRLLGQNKMITYLADQDAGSHGIFVDFFGRPASTLRGPAVLSVRTGCPIVPVFMVREGTDHHRAVVGELLWPDAALPNREAVRDLTQRFTNVLEQVIRRYPGNYFWMHRRWKTRPPVS